jgi:hypothetical protein
MRTSSVLPSTASGTNAQLKPVQNVDLSKLDRLMTTTKANRVGTVALAQRTKISVDDGGTTIRLLPGNAATVVGVSNGYAKGGAFLLMPNQGVVNAVRNGDVGDLWSKGLAQSTLFLTGSNMVTAFMKKIGIPATSGLYQQVDKLGANAVCTFKFADGSFEVGAGKSQKVAKGAGLVFWNARAEVANASGVVPNGARVSGNAGVLGNVGAAGAKLLSKAGAFIARAPEKRVAAAGAFLKGIGDGSAAIGTATKTDIWGGFAARADISIKGTNGLRVEDAGGNDVYIPRLNLEPPGITLPPGTSIIPTL